MFCFLAPHTTADELAVLRDHLLNRQCSNALNIYLSVNFSFTKLHSGLQSALYFITSG